MTDEARTAFTNNGVYWDNAIVNADVADTGYFRGQTTPSKKVVTGVLSEAVV
jgi:hypothetical protein